MRLRDILISTVLSLGAVKGENFIDKIKDEEEAVKGYVHMTFDKLFGDTFDSASKERTDIRRLYRRDSNDYENLTIISQYSFYSMSLGLGSNEQNVTVLVDTGSSDLWVMGNENPYCKTGTKKDSKWVDSFDIDSRSKINCTKYGLFDPSSSTSFKSNDTSFSVQYGDTTKSSGVWGNDKALLLGTNVTIPNLSFGVSNLSNSSVGVMGIGFPQLEVTYSGGKGNTKTPYMYNNFPKQLQQLGDIKSNVYSLYLGDSTETSKGNILFGAVDHSRYDGTLFTVPIINTMEKSGYTTPIQFDITMNGLGITHGKNSTTFTTTTMPALLDSGTSLMYLPRILVDEIAHSINATYKDKYGYTVPCSFDNPEPFNDTELVFNFNGLLFHTDINNYLLQISADTCLLGISPSTDNSTLSVVLGDIFLSNAYVVYDLDNYQISMAPAKFNLTEKSDIEVIKANGSIPNAITAPAYDNTWSTSESYSTGGDIFTLTVNTSKASHNNSSINTSKTPMGPVVTTTITSTTTQDTSSSSSSSSTSDKDNNNNSSSSSSSSSSTSSTSTTTTSKGKKKKTKKQKTTTTTSTSSSSSDDSNNDWVIATTHSSVAKRQIQAEIHTQINQNSGIVTINRLSTTAIAITALLFSALL